MASVGPGELLILALILLPVLAVVLGLGALVYFLTKKPSRLMCRACGLPNAMRGRPCPRCGVVVG